MVQVHMDGFQFEVATFRTDSTGSDGRRPDSVGILLHEGRCIAQGLHHQCHVP